MLHEVLFALSGHPSPLLRSGNSSRDQSVLSAPEQELLRTAGHLSEVHCNLISYTAQISASHPSTICRAVSTAIKSVHLAAFQRKVLDVEDSILRKDAGLVGAYNIVPLTAVMGEFSGWTRRMDWLWDLVQFMLRRSNEKRCTGAAIIDKLRSELQTGYADIEETALSLVQVAETAWLKSVCAWVLYGRIPSFGGDDFFIQEDEESEQNYRIEASLLPAFVTASTASSMLFIGTSLNRLRGRTSLVVDSSIGGLSHLSLQLQELSKLTFPLSSAAFSRAIFSVRQTLSRTTLQELLPLERVMEMLHLLREFFLLGRGEFAMALTQQVDQKVQDRWRRADNLAFEKKEGLGTVVVKEGEVAVVLARTWAILGAMQNQHAEEDEELELARDLIRLDLSKNAGDASKSKSRESQDSLRMITATSFQNLLFSVPVTMTLQVPSPLDLFLSTTDIQTYTAINSYLLSIRRAHLHLTDLWKMTSLRRQHPPPPRPPYSLTKGGRAKTHMLRERWSARALALRSVWTTCSATIFFLAETEAYLQIDVVEELWSDFQSWLTSAKESVRESPRLPSVAQVRSDNKDITMADDGQPRLKQKSEVEPTTSPHDPQTLSVAHRLCLRTLIRRLLLNQPSFTNSLYYLLKQVDHFVAFIHRLHGIWTSMDLEADEGVVDAFHNLRAEEAEVMKSIVDVEKRVKKGIEEVVAVLRRLSVDSAFLAEMEDDEALEDKEDGLDVEMRMSGEEEGRYVPKRIGGVDRLLMKLDFGGWFDGVVGGSDDVHMVGSF